MELLSDDDLATFFRKYDNHYVNEIGMQFGFSEENGIWTYLTHQTHDEGPWEVSICTENDNLSSFATGFKLTSFQELDQLDYTSSWMRYLNGDAEIIIEPMELEIPVSFRIHHQKTIIFCLQKHFYDEEYRHLMYPRDFEEYFSQNEDLLYRISSFNR